LIEKEIPHNLLFSNKGNVCYIFPRKFEEAEANLPLNSFWNDLSGLVTVRDSEYFDKLSNIEEIYKIYKENISLSDEEFLELTNNITDHFSNTYKIKKAE
jgi:hypothetical protein